MDIVESCCIVLYNLYIMYIVMVVVAVVLVLGFFVRIFCLDRYHQRNSVVSSHLARPSLLSFSLIEYGSIGGAV